MTKPLSTTARKHAAELVAGGEEPFIPPDLAEHLRKVERDALLAALVKFDFNRTRAAAALGLNLRQMRYRMSTAGIVDEGDAKRQPD